MSSLKIDQNPELASFDSNKDGALEPKELLKPLSDDQAAVLGKFIAGLLKKNGYSEACAFLRELGNLKPKTAWQVKHAVDFSPMPAFDFESPKISFGGYAFPVRVKGEELTPMELSRIAFVLAQNWEYFPLLAGGVEGDDGEVLEAPLSFKLVPEGEIEGMKANRLDYDFGALYLNDQNTVFMSRNPDIDTVMHEFNHAIDDFMAAGQDDDYISASPSHGVKKEEFYKPCVQIGKKDFKDFNRLYDLTEKRTLTEKERSLYQRYQKRLEAMGVLDSSQCFESETVAYSHYFTGAAGLLDYFEFLERWLTANDLYGVPITPEDRTRELEKMPTGFLNSPEIGVSALNYLNRHFFLNPSVSFDAKRLLIEKIISFSRNDQPPSEKIMSALGELVAVYCRLRLERAAGLKREAQIAEIVACFNFFIYFKRPAIDPALKAFSDFFAHAKFDSRTKTEVFDGILMYAWNCDLEVWKALAGVVLQSFMANSTIPISEKETALKKSWNMYSEKSEVSDRADIFFKGLIQHPAVPDEVKTLVLAQAMTRLGKTFSEYNPQTNQSFWNASHYKKAERVQSVEKLLTDFLSDPEASPKLKRKYLDAMDQLALYQTREHAIRAKAPNAALWPVPASLVECWAASPQELQSSTRILKAVFALPNAHALVPENFIGLLGGIGTEEARPYTLELYASIAASLQLQPPEFQAALVQKMVKGILTLNLEAQAAAFKQVFLSSEKPSPGLQKQFERELIGSFDDGKSATLIWGILRDDSIAPEARASLAHALKAEIANGDYSNGEELLKDLEPLMPKE